MPSSASTKPPDPEQVLIDLMAACAADPLKWVQVVFPWGDGELAAHEGPDTWQADVLAQVRDNLSRNEPVRIAVSSGNGPGKSALSCWLMLWAQSTCTDARTVITANTGVQLLTKTWPELAKWHRLCLCKHWFELNSATLRATDAEHRDTWRADAITWSKERVEAFAGLHNRGRRILLIFDEASAIEDIIWETAEGALTDADTEIVWAVFGNPTRGIGRFRQCFPGGRFAHRWLSRKIDTRTARMANQAEIAKWIEDYGEDHDFVRVRVKGEFPRVGSMQFIGQELAESAAAAAREPLSTFYDALVMGVDVARFGDDRSVIRFRRGRDARSIKPLKFRGVDTMQLAAKVAELYEQHKPDGIFVDGGGVGGGVVDRCRYLKLPVTEVLFGAKPDRDQIGQDGAVVYYNKRAEMWGLMREWLRGGAVDNDPELISDLTAVQYGYGLKDGRDALQLERKEDMRKRDLASPDDGDALALTFAYPIAASDHVQQFSGQAGFVSDYRPLDNM